MLNRARHKRWLKRRLAAAGAFLVFAVSPVLADVIIVATDVPTYKRGQILQDNDVIDVPANARVTVLLSTNAVREIKGPVKQTVADLSKGRPSIATSLWQQVVAFFNTGGVGSSAGATRSFSTPSVSDTPLSADTWRAVPLDVSDTACVAAGQPIKFGRRDTRSSFDFRIADAGMTGVAGVSFAAGQSEASWPGEIPAATGSYMLLIPGVPPKRFTLKIIETRQLQGETVLESLEREGCRSQLKLWLQSAAGG